MTYWKNAKRENRFSLRDGVVPRGKKGKSAWCWRALFYLFRHESRYWWYSICRSGSLEGRFNEDALEDDGSKFRTSVG